MFFSEKLTRLLSAGLHRAYSNEPSMLETITSKTKEIAYDPHDASLRLRLPGRSLPGGGVDC